jgi:hypothetical protein
MGRLVAVVAYPLVAPVTGWAIDVCHALHAIVVVTYVASKTVAAIYAIHAAGAIGVAHLRLFRAVVATRAAILVNCAFCARVARAIVSWIAVRLIKAINTIQAVQSADLIVRVAGIAVVRSAVQLAAHSAMGSLVAVVAGPGIAPIPVRAIVVVQASDATGRNALLLVIQAVAPKTIDVFAVSARALPIRACIVSCADYPVVALVVIIVGPRYLGDRRIALPARVFRILLAVDTASVVDDTITFIYCVALVGRLIAYLCAGETVVNAGIAGMIAGSAGAILCSCTEFSIITIVFVVVGPRGVRNQYIALPAQIARIWIAIVATFTVNHAVIFVYRVARAGVWVAIQSAIQTIIRTRTAGMVADSSRAALCACAEILVFASVIVVVGPLGLGRGRLALLARIVRIELPVRAAGAVDHAIAGVYGVARVRPLVARGRTQKAVVYARIAGVCARPCGTALVAGAELAVIARIVGIDGPRARRSGCVALLAQIARVLLSMRAAGLIDNAVSCLEDVAVVHLIVALRGAGETVIWTRIARMLAHS